MKILLTVFVFLFISAQSYSNFGGAGNQGNQGNGHFQAIGTSQVEILNENLLVELHQSYASVSVEYEMHNTGDAVDVKAGFPAFEQRTNMDIVNYEIRDNGNVIPFFYKRGEKDAKLTQTDPMEGNEISVYLSWLVSTVHFNKNEKRKIRISYLSKYLSGFSSISADEDLTSDKFSYLLSTGATWKGPIHRGKVTIRPVSVRAGQFTLTPDKRFKKSGNDLVWEFNDLEPSIQDDIIIDFHNSMTVAYGPYSNPIKSVKMCWLVVKPNGDKKTAYFDTQDYSIKSTSELKSTKYFYSAVNVMDLDENTVWAEGSEGSGIGESLTLTLTKPLDISQIGIIPGYHKSETLYFANNRVAALKIEINGESEINQDIPDEYNYNSARSPKAYFYIDISKYNKPVKTLKLTITKVYKGNKYDDTCITSILLRKTIKDPKFQGSR